MTTSGQSTTQAELAAVGEVYVVFRFFMSQIVCLAGVFVPILVAAGELPPGLALCGWLLPLGYAWQWHTPPRSEP